MLCSNCGSDKVNVSLVQSGAISNTKKKGCLFAIGRLILIICTLGLWMIFGKKAAKTKTRIINTSMAVCQSCGNSWSVGAS